MHEMDNCEFCLGHKEGVKGNENVFKALLINDVKKVLVCDYCSSILLDILRYERGLQPQTEDPNIE